MQVLENAHYVWYLLKDVVLYLSIYLSIYLSRSLVDRWGATDALTAISLHFYRFTVILSVSLRPNMFLFDGRNPTDPINPADPIYLD